MNNEEKIKGAPSREWLESWWNSDDCREMWHVIAEHVENITNDETSNDAMLDLLDDVFKKFVYDKSKPSRGLLFSDITSRIENFGKTHLSYWGCALAGEVGELCNMIKKIERDNKLYEKVDIAHELADIFIYTELTARIFDIDLEKAIVEKLEIVKKRRELKKNNDAPVTSKKG